MKKGFHFSVSELFMVVLPWHLFAMVVTSTSFSEMGTLQFSSLRNQHVNFAI